MAVLESLETLSSEPDVGSDSSWNSCLALSPASDSSYKLTYESSPGDLSPFSSLSTSSSAAAATSSVSHSSKLHPAVPLTVSGSSPIDEEAERSETPDGPEDSGTVDGLGDLTELWYELRDDLAEGTGSEASLGLARGVRRISSSGHDRPLGAGLGWRRYVSVVIRIPKSQQVEHLQMPPRRQFTVQSLMYRACVASKNVHR